MQAACGTPKQQSDLEVLNQRRLQRVLLSKAASTSQQTSSLCAYLPSNPEFPFSGQVFLHALGRVLILLVFDKDLNRRAVPEHAVKSTNIVNARDTWRILFEIIQTS